MTLPLYEDERAAQLAFQRFVAEGMRDEASWEELHHKTKHALIRLVNEIEAGNDVSDFRAKFVEDHGDNDAAHRYVDRTFEIIEDTIMGVKIENAMPKRMSGLERQDFIEPTRAQRTIEKHNAFLQVVAKAGWNAFTSDVKNPSPWEVLSSQEQSIFLKHAAAMLAGRGAAVPRGTVPARQRRTPSSPAPGPGPGRWRASR